jgi:HEAT repeat protein
MDGELLARLDQVKAQLGRQDARMREDAVSLLVELTGAPELHSRLKLLVGPLLEDPQPMVRAGAVAALRALTPEAEVLAAFDRPLSDPDARVRREAIRGLAQAEQPGCAGRLAQALSDPDAQVAFEAAVGLAALRDAAGTALLLQGLDDKYRRFAALGALAQLGEKRAQAPAERLLKAFFASEFERTQAAGLLAKLGAEAGRAFLLDRVKRKRADDRGLAMELCGEHRVLAAIPALREALASPDDPCRGPAARSLGLLGEDPRGLIALAQDASADDGARCDAMEGLMFLGTPEATAALESLRKSEPRQELREAAGDALRWLAAHPGGRP